MRTANDSAWPFWEAHRGQFTWDLLPMEFLYELYKAWFDNDKPSSLLGHEVPQRLDEAAQGGSPAEGGRRAVD